MKNYYQILGLEENASTLEIEKSYKIYSEKYNPDLHNGDAFFKQKYQEIEEAYKYLTLNHLIVNFEATKIIIDERTRVRVEWNTTNTTLILLKIKSGCDENVIEVEPYGKKYINFISYKNDIELILYAKNKNKLEAKSIIVKYKGENIYNNNYIGDISMPKRNIKSNNKAFILGLFLFLIIFASMLLFTKSPVKSKLITNYIYKHETKDSIYTYKYWYSNCPSYGEDGIPEYKRSLISGGTFTITIDISNELILLNSNGIKDKYYIERIIIDGDEDCDTTYFLRGDAGYMFMCESECHLQIKKNSECNYVFSNKITND